MILGSLGLIFVLGLVLCLVGKVKQNKVLFYLGVLIAVVSIIDLVFLVVLFVKLAICYLALLCLVLLVLWFVFRLSRKEDLKNLDKKSESDDN